MAVSQRCSHYLFLKKLSLLKRGNAEWSVACDDGIFIFPKLQQASEWKFTYIYNERSIVSI